MTHQNLSISGIAVDFCINILYEIESECKISFFFLWTSVTYFYNDRFPSTSQIKICRKKKK